MRTYSELSIGLDVQRLEGTLIRYLKNLEDNKSTKVGVLKLRKAITKIHEGTLEALASIFSKT